MKAINFFGKIAFFATICVCSRLFLVPLIWRKQIIFSDNIEHVNQDMFNKALYHTLVIICAFGVSYWLYVAALILATLTDLFIFAKKNAWFKNRK